MKFLSKFSLALSLACLTTLPLAASKAPLISGTFQLTDVVSGKTVNQQTYDGDYRLVFFGFTHCALTCPLGLHKMGKVLEKLDHHGKHLQPLFITLDPERDTAEVIHEYVQAFDPRIKGLRGTRAQTNAALKAFRMEVDRIETAPGEYQYEHPGLFYLMDRQGGYLGTYSSNAKTTELVAQLKAVLKRR